MSHTPSTPTKRFRRGQTLRDDLRFNTTDGVLYSISVGLGEAFFAKFVHELGLGPVAVGLVLTVPVLVGAALQTIGPPIVRRARDFRGWVVGTAALQAAILLPMIALAVLLPSIKPTLLVLPTLLHGLGAGFWASVATIALPVLAFALIALYWAAGLATSPAWNAWTGLLIPRAVRGHYFGIRTFQCQLSTLLALLAGGWLLDHVPGVLGVSTLAAFGVTFALAAACRFGSAYYLARYSTPARMPVEERVPVAEFVRRIRRSHDGRFLAYVLAVMFAAQISQPFFNPFMFNVLKVSTADYAWLIAGPYLGRMIAAPLAGMVAKRRGPRLCLEIGGSAIIPMSLVWLVSDAFWWLLAAQIITGAIWAMFELGQQLLNLEALAQNERSSLLTKFILLQEVFRTSGSLAGGKILDAMQASPGAYTWVFWVSTLVRAGAVLLLVRLRRAKDPA